MNRCQTCKYRKMILLKLRQTYLRNKSDYCALHKKLIHNDCGCEMWQGRKTDYTVFEIKADSTLEELNIVVWDLEEIRLKIFTEGSD